MRAPEDGRTAEDAPGGKHKLRKLLRFAAIYGPGRALVKAMGRLRVGFSLGGRGRGYPGVGVIGCGQFAFSTIAYFVRRSARLVACHDVDAKAGASFSRLYGAKSVPDTAAILADPAIEIVYVASNHASHAEYAIAALEAGKRVYVEKPVAVTLPQLAALHAAVGAGDRSAKIFAGYNRPFSGAVRHLVERLGNPSGPLTLSCFISGHVIGPEHWYRRPEEGTRICGNVGHWLDLAVHLLSLRHLPDRWHIMLAWTNPESRDDDVAISLTSESGDLVNIVLTARSEPFEGINETINLQWGGLIAKIDDFRAMTVWEGVKLKRSRYWPKDVGHRLATLQPFHGGRNWGEVEHSSLLMLRIADMVVRGERSADFSFASEYATLEALSQNTST